MPSLAVTWRWLAKPVSLAASCGIVTAFVREQSWNSNERTFTAIVGPFSCVRTVAGPQQCFSLFCEEHSTSHKR